MYMGDYIVIDHKTGPFEYACESVSTGTPFNARWMMTKERSFQITRFLINIPSPAGSSGRREIVITAPFTGIVRRNANSIAA